MICYVFFKYFNHFNGRLPLTNGFLILPAGEIFESAETISLKTSMKCFKEKNLTGSFFYNFYVLWAYFLVGILYYQKIP